MQKDGKERSIIHSRKKGCSGVYRREREDVSRSVGVIQ